MEYTLLSQEAARAKFKEQRAVAFTVMGMVMLGTAIGCVFVGMKWALGME